jgi:GT2 family glycosyltransferase
MRTERIRAALRFIYPDDITPMGKRVLEKVLDDMDRHEAPVSAGASVCPKEDA